MPIFWHNIFNKEGANMKKTRRYVFTYLSVYLIAPTISVVIGCMPVVMEMIARRTRILEHPPEIDPSIIADIYFGRSPKTTSFETDRTDNKNPASVASPKYSPSITL